MRNLSHSVLIFNYDFFKIKVTFGLEIKKQWRQLKLLKLNIFEARKTRFFSYYSFVKGFKDTVVNWAWHSINGVSLNN